MRYNGYLDTNDGWTVWGWAFDSQHPNQPVDVDYMLSSGVTGTVRASEYRADLEANGIGDGRHAFSITLPLPLQRNDDQQISATIRGTDFILKGSPMVRANPVTVGVVAADVVNNCNLRCPFCMVDYTNIPRLSLMTDETFSRASPLISLVPDGHFWLSCLHEPTLHPKLLDYIESINPGLRKKFSFTTNLAKRLPDDFWRRVAESGLHSVRVSYDSNDPAVFGALRKGAKYEVFRHNLESLSAQFARVSDAPRLRFITLAFTNNHQHIPALVREGCEVWGASSHEVRYFYYVPHISAWGREHMLTPDQWRDLEASITPFGKLTELEINGPSATFYAQMDASAGTSSTPAPSTSFGPAHDGRSTAIPSPAVLARSLRDEPIRLKLRWDGLVGIDGYADDLFAVNINSLESPCDYFHEVRIEARRLAALQQG